MKEEKQRLMRTLADAYQSGWAKWLFGGLCCQLLLPFLLKTALLYIEKHSLDVLTLFPAESARNRVNTSSECFDPVPCGFCRDIGRRGLCVGCSPVSPA